MAEEFHKTFYFCVILSFFWRVILNVDVYENLMDLLYI